ncbi:MAG: hypothetical protein JWN69_2406, partial [Alphaproteobacteria bacterium]|nr:hypothetical protein [Alphaproteobacteria bacterium]
MLKISRVSLLASAALLPGAALAQAAPSAMADQPPAPAAVEANAPPAAAATGADGPSDIIVTARRQNENLQDVPAAVSVLTAETLQQTGARMATDFVNLTSGVTIQSAATEPGDVSINIRGLNGARDAENNVALVIDGVLRTNNVATTQPQGAISQVEIIKGPQGALYGRNASAGAIVITTVKPSDVLRGELRATAGDDNTYLVSGMLSGPLTDQIGFTIQAEHSRSDGHFRNVFLSSDLNQQVYPGNSTDASSIDSYKKTYVFGRLLIAPSDDTEIDIKANYGYQEAGA